MVISFPLKHNAYSELHSANVILIFILVCLSLKTSMTSRLAAHKRCSKSENIIREQKHKEETEWDSGDLQQQLVC